MMRYFTWGELQPEMRTWTPRQRVRSNMRRWGRALISPTPHSRPCRQENEWGDSPSFHIFLIGQILPQWGLICFQESDHSLITFKWNFLIRFKPVNHSLTYIKMRLLVWLMNTAHHWVSSLENVGQSRSRADSDGDQQGPAGQEDGEDDEADHVSAGPFLNQRRGQHLPWVQSGLNCWEISYFALTR